MCLCNLKKNVTKDFLYIFQTPCTRCHSVFIQLKISVYKCDGQGYPWHWSHGHGLGSVLVTRDLTELELEWLHFVRQLLHITNLRGCIWLCNIYLYMYMQISLFYFCILLSPLEIIILYCAFIMTDYLSIINTNDPYLYIGDCNMPIPEIFLTSNGSNINFIYYVIFSAWE